MQNRSVMVKCFARLNCFRFTSAALRKLNVTVQLIFCISNRIGINFSCLSKLDEYRYFLTVRGERLDHFTLKGSLCGMAIPTSEELAAATRSQ